MMGSIELRTYTITKENINWILHQKFRPRFKLWLKCKGIILSSIINVIKLKIIDGISKKKLFCK